MSKKDDGGPAFSCPSRHARIKDWHPGHGEIESTVAVCQSGMSHRDWLAGLAMQAYLHPDHVRTIIAISNSCRDTDETIASASYAIADEMLKARAK